MGSSEDKWGDDGSYDGYSLSRDLAASETLQVYSPGEGGTWCLDTFCSVSGLLARC